MGMKFDGLVFEWDEEKNRINQRKHGVRFELAARVFRDENKVEIFDRGHSHEEDRWQVIGMVNKILFVVYTERGSHIRIISARPANRTERRMYHDRNLYYP